MTRVILCQIGYKPRVASLAADLGGHAAALESLFGAPVARLPLLDGIELYCDRESLLFGLALVRRALAMSLAEPWRPEITLRLDRSALSGDVWPGYPDEWPIGGDFLLARVAPDGELVDMTESDIRLWRLWLRLDYILNPDGSRE